MRDLLLEARHAVRGLSSVAGLVRISRVPFWPSPRVERMPATRDASAAEEISRSGLGASCPREVDHGIAVDMQMVGEVKLPSAPKPREAFQMRSLDGELPLALRPHKE